VILFASAGERTFSTFTLATGFPMAIILPMIAILSVTGEWSQRTGLTTFTQVPHRGRVILAKGIAVLLVAVASMLLAFAIGAAGNLLGALVAGTHATWDQGATDLAAIVLGNTLVLFVGFMLGLLIRNSAGAIVAYFVFGFVAPPLLELLASTQGWFRDPYPWADPNVTQKLLFHGPLVGEQWAQLAFTTLVWLVLPTAIGIRAMLRSEVK
jgi:ABC-type transport system involved in multi-copper enzyme maturation permease subunit